MYGFERKSADELWLPLLVKHPSWNNAALSVNELIVFVRHIPYPFVTSALVGANAKV